MPYHAGDDRAGHVARCVCGHNRQRHEVPGFDGECIAEACTCKTFRPVTPAAGPVRVAPTPVTVEQTVRVAKVFGDTRARLVAERIEHLTVELKALLAAGRAKAHADHTAAQIKSLPKPRGEDKTTRNVNYGEFPCPEDGCDFVSTTAQGRGAHRRWQHGYQAGA